MNSGIEISLAMLIAAAARMLLGWFWYSRILFAKQWKRLTGRDEKDLKKMSPATKLYLFELGASLLIAYMLGNIVGLFSAESVVDGATVGLWVGIGFVLTTTLGDYMFAKRPKELYFINNGYQLVSLVVMGIILALWS